MWPRLVDHPAKKAVKGLSVGGSKQLGWAAAPGFAGNPHLLFTLSRDPRTRHPRSVFAAVAQDHLTTIIPPAMGTWSAYAHEFLDHLAACADAVVLVGLSHGGVFMSDMYRAWRALPEPSRRPRHLGLVLWSVPPSPRELRPQAWLGLKMACSLPRAAVSSRLLQSTFIRPLERRRASREPQQGAEILQLWKDSIRSSAVWWRETLREVGRTSGLGPPLDPSGSVVALNVPPATDDALNVPRAMAAIRRSYPGCPNFEVAAAKRHAIPENDGAVYAPVLSDIRAYFLQSWGLAS
jgi:hypothetical protein